MSAPIPVVSIVVVRCASADVEPRSTVAESNAPSAGVDVLSVDVLSVDVLSVDVLSVAFSVDIISIPHANGSSESVNRRTGKGADQADQTVVGTVL